MSTWVRAVAIWHGFAAMGTLGMVAVGAVFARRSTAPDDLPLVGALLALGAAFGALLAAVAVGLWKRRPWARRPALLLAGVLLLSGGGTIPAVLTLIVLLHPEGRALFVRGGAPEGSRTGPG